VVGLRMPLARRRRGCSRPHAPNPCNALGGGLSSVYGRRRRRGKRWTGVRSDARQNRLHLLDVTVALVLEVGGEPTRESIAERARVGIGTVYRHFPDRQSLLHAVVRHALERTIAAGEAIVADENSEDVLRQYLHAAVDNGIGAVNIVHPLLDDTIWPDLSARAESLLSALIERNRRDHPRRADLSSGDIAFATIRFGRPLAIGLPASADRDIAHRQLDQYLDGLGRATSPMRRPRKGTST
jgi:AcrR family transcriptional regulator